MSRIRMIDFAGQSLHLLPDRAAWWPAAEALVVADLHFGKSATFRAAGVPVPSGATAKDLSRLDALIGQTAPRRLFILGDLLHSRFGRDTQLHETVATWRHRHVDLQITLVRGNHDRAAGAMPAEWEMIEVEEPFDTAMGLHLSHDPCCDCPAATLCGHVHPTYALRDYDGSAVSVPCFVLDHNRLILPAFGTFTGGHRMTLAPDRRIYIAAAGKVLAA